MDGQRPRKIHRKEKGTCLCERVHTHKLVLLKEIFDYFCLWEDGVDLPSPIPSSKVQVKTLDIMYKTKRRLHKLERRKQTG